MAKMEGRKKEKAGIITRTRVFNFLREVGIY
jgi:hypothetical protein